MEWSGVEWNKDLIPLFEYWMEWNGMSCNFFISLLPLFKKHIKLGTDIFKIYFFGIMNL